MSTTTEHIRALAAAIRDGELASEQRECEPVQRAYAELAATVRPSGEKHAA